MEFLSPGTGRRNAGRDTSSLRSEDRDRNPGQPRQNAFTGQRTKRRLLHREIQRSLPSPPELSLQVSTNQYIHVGQQRETQTRGRMTRKTSKETRVSTHTGPGIIPASASQTGKHCNSWSNRQSVQKHFDSVVNKKIALDQIPLLSHLSKPKTSLQRLTLLPSNFIASQKEAQKYLQIHTNISNNVSY